MVTYIAKAPLFVCPPGTEDRRNYAPGDTIHDFAAWPDYARRALISSGEVAPCRTGDAQMDADLDALGDLAGITAGGVDMAMVVDALRRLQAAQKGTPAPRAPEQPPQPQTVDPMTLPDDVDDPAGPVPDATTPQTPASDPNKRRRPRRHPQQPPTGP